MKQIVFASNNKNKLIEIQSILNSNFQVLSLADINCFDDIPETGNSFNENAQMKVDYIFNKYKVNCFADDSGLVVESLNGAPGIMSARYAGEPSNSERNMAKLLDEIEGNKNRKAYFIAIIALIIDGNYHFFEGRVNGKITDKIIGNGGFGYDPIFIPDGYTKTFAELSPEIKNSISHRAIAVRKLADFLLTK